MLLTLALATLCGVYLAAVAGWPVIVIGLVSMAMGVGYTGGPYPLAYHGLGDAFVFVFFGPVATGATYFVQAQAWSFDALAAGVGLGFFSTAMLVVNNLRDRETDAAAGKRTLAVMFGDRFTVAQYFACLAAAAAVPLAGVGLWGWPPATLLSLVALIPCVPAARLVAGFSDRRALNPALGMTARGLAFYGAGLGLGAALPW